jgi:hypothetical protein
MLFTVQSGKNLDDYRGKNTSAFKVKHLLPFKKWVLRNDQPVRDDGRGIFVGMIST